jgi:hypothetical protein
MIGTVAASSQFGFVVDEDEGEEPEIPQGDGPFDRGCFVIQRGKYYWTWLPIPKRHAWGCVTTLWLMPGTGYRYAEVDIEAKIKFTDDPHVYTECDAIDVEWENLSEFYYVSWHMDSYGEAQTRVQWISMEIWVDVEGFELLNRKITVYGNHGSNPIDIAPSQIIGEGIAQGGQQGQQG